MATLRPTAPAEVRGLAQRALEARRRDVDRVAVEVAAQEVGHARAERVVDARRVVDVDAEPVRARELDGEHLDLRQPGLDRARDLPLELSFRCVRAGHVSPLPAKEKGAGGAHFEPPAKCCEISDSSARPGDRPTTSTVRAMATMADLDELALALPQVTKEVSEDGRPAYHMHGKMFCFHRSRRPDAVDPQTGERLADVLMFRVPDLDVKDLMLSDERGVYFTTPHFNGYPAVLMRISDLARIDREELRDLVVEAWLTRARSASPRRGSPSMPRLTTEAAARSVRRRARS